MLNESVASLESRTISWPPDAEPDAIYLMPFWWVARMTKRPGTGRCGQERLLMRRPDEDEQ